MKLVVQRAISAEVKVDNKVVGSINNGLVVFVGVTHNDNEKVADFLVNKLVNLRIFSDSNDKMNLSVKDVNGEILIVSQFTLYADCKKGFRPSYTDAAEPVRAEKLYNYFCDKCKQEDVNIQTGIFKADMKVSLINDGPVTIILEKNND